jgi:hypothetical protein
MSRSGQNTDTKPANTTSVVKLWLRADGWLQPKPERTVDVPENMRSWPGGSLPHFASIVGR